MTRVAARGLAPAVRTRAGHPMVLDDQTGAGLGAGRWHLRAPSDVRAGNRPAPIRACRYPGRCSAARAFSSAAGHHLQVVVVATEDVVRCHLDLDIEVAAGRPG